MTVASNAFKVQACPVPAPSEISRRLAGASFHDSYGCPLRGKDADAPAISLALRIFLNTPGWVERLMRLRNRIVGWWGLKNEGSFTHGFDPGKPADHYRVGDRIGLFSVMYLTPEEVIIGVDDRHLDVRISVCKWVGNGEPQVAVSTVVHEHNSLGRAYMFFVRPAHRVIAPATLRHGLAWSR